MSTRIRSPRLAALALTLTMMSASFAMSAPTAAAADPIIPLHWKVNASTHIRSLNMDVTIPEGTFDGQVNLATGELSGNLTLPPAVQHIKLFGVSLAPATFAVTQSQPVHGHVDIANLTATVTSSFTMQITQASLTWLPWLNLVGRSCRGSQPVTVTMSGPVSLTAPSSFAAEYTIPSFTGCGLATPLLNLVIPGGGNTFSASFAPA